LAIAGDQVDAPIAAGRGLSLQLGQQRRRVAVPTMAAVRPDPLKFGGLVVEAAERPVVTGTPRSTPINKPPSGAAKSAGSPRNQVRWTCSVPP
jgi:hypothetical protein